MKEVKVRSTDQKVRKEGKSWEEEVEGTELAKGRSVKNKREHKEKKEQKEQKERKEQKGQKKQREEQKESFRSLFDTL
jgi:hypothetical protein